MDIDSALAIVGGYRRWNITLFLLLSIGLAFPLCWNILSLIFTGWAPNHVCSTDNSMLNVNAGNLQDNITNITSFANFHNLSQHLTSLKCHDFRLINHENVSVTNVSWVSFERHPCTNWKYENDGYMTITEEWNLVCDRNYLTELSQVFLQVGCMVGDVVLSRLVDLHGRRLIFGLCHGALFLLGVTCSFATSYIMFVTCLLFTGVFSSGAITSGKLLVLEIFDSKHRSMPGISGQMMWTVGHLSLGGLAYLVTQWRTLQLVLSALPGLFFLFCFILPESPVWLLMRGKVQKAERVLRDLAKWNGVQLDPGKKLLSAIIVSIKQPNSKSQNQVSQNYEKEETSFSSHSSFSVKLSPYLESQRIDGKQEKTGNSTNHPTVKDMLTNCLLLKYLFSSCILFFSGLFVIIGIAFTIPSLAGNRFMNYTILGAVELPSPIVAACLSERIGKRVTLFSFLLTAGCSLSTVACLTLLQFDEDVSYWSSITLLMLAKFFTFGAFSITILYTKEFFPTNFRATSTGICQIWGRVGVLTASFVAYLNKIQFTWAPHAIFGLISTVAALSVLLLPETRGMPLPETIEDCYKFKKTKPLN